jgi:putative peptidoglycan lipid II flippase
MTVISNPEELPLQPKRRAAGFAMLVGMGILLSRIAGLIREKVFAHYFGNSNAAGAFKAALRIPNFLQNLFGEGVLSASFIPVYARLLAEGDEELAGRVAGVVVTLLALITSILVLLGVIFTPWILFAVAPGFSGDVRLLTIQIVRIMFPGIGLLVISAWCLGILNSHRRFFISYVAPVFMNIAMIAVLVICGRKMADASLAIAAAWGTVIGAALQLGVQVPFVFKYGKQMRYAIDMTLEPVREVLRNFGPVVVGRGVIQLSAYLDSLLASLLGAAAVSGLAYQQIIYLLPISLFAMSVTAAELPQMSSAMGTPEEIFGKLRTRMERGLRQIAFFVIPSVVAFIAIGNALVAALYQGGKFSPDDTRYVWYILIGSTVGLLASAMGRLYSSAFYALRDTKTPLRYAIMRVILTGVLGYLSCRPLRPLLVAALQLAHVPLPSMATGTIALGAIGLTASAGIAGWLEYLLLRHGLQKRVGEIRLAPSFQLKLWLSAAVAGVSGAAFYRFIVPRIGPHLPRILPHIRDGGLVVVVFGFVYFAMAMLTGIPEAQATLRRFKR